MIDRRVNPDRRKNSINAEIHKELKEILDSVQLTAECLTEQNNNLFMQGYSVGYKDMQSCYFEAKEVLLKMYSLIRNIEVTLSCHLIDEELEAQILKIIGDCK